MLQRELDKSILFANLLWSCLKSIHIKDRRRRFVGRDVEVLVEGLSKKPHLNRADHEDNPQLIGRTATDYIVVFNGPENLTGRFANVKITRTSALTFFGKLI